MVKRPLDPVAKRLADSGNENAASVLEWLDGQQQRRAMHRRATWCSLSSWLLVSAAAVVSTAVALFLSSDIRQIFEQSGILGVPWSLKYMPAVLVGISLLLVLGGIVSWMMEKVPGLSTTRSAIDWSAGSEAVTRLLSVGCTYPEAFRTAAQVTHSQSSRNWLMSAAQRVEKGGAEVVLSDFASGDSAIAELLVDADGSEPVRRWQTAADHFFDLAQRRLVLLLSSMPIFATIVSGLLIWVSISSSLGLMWRAVAELIGGLR